MHHYEALTFSDTQRCAICSLHRRRGHVSLILPVDVKFLDRVRSDSEVTKGGSSTQHGLPKLSVTILWTNAAFNSHL